MGRAGTIGCRETESGKKGGVAGLLRELVRVLLVEFGKMWRVEELR